MENQVWNLMETETLVNGVNWEGASSTVRAMVFGKMIILGRDRIKNYESDLFHDAKWIEASLNGPMSFDWIAREYGTWIGEVVSHINCVENDRKYRFEILCVDDRKWTLSVYEAGPIDLGAKYRDAVLPPLPTNINYSENEAYQKEAAKIQNPILSPGLIAMVEDELVNTDVNPINWTIDKLFGGPKFNMPWADRHAALPVEECDVAKAIEGCIFHPAPVGGWTTMDHQIAGTLEYEPGDWREENPSNPGHDYYGNQIPTLRNNSTRKVNSMDDIRRVLEGKLSDLQEKLDELNSAADEIRDATEIAERNIEQVEGAIESLDLDLEDFYVTVDVSFDN